MSVEIPRVRFPVMHQGWLDLTFLHWRIPASALAPLIPRGLSVDTFDGSAWIGVTPFRVAGLRPPFSPPLPWISNFPETNCRTYVRGASGPPAIWFFSLDCARAAAVLGARLGYGLPYVWSRMRVEAGARAVRYWSRRRWPDRRARTEIEIERVGGLEPGPREIFLTARYCLYSRIAGRLAYADVEHAPWPLESARVIHCEQNLAGVDGEPLAHFSPGVWVRIGRPRFA